MRHTVRTAKITARESKRKFSDRRPSIVPISAICRAEKLFLYRSFNVKQPEEIHDIEKAGI
jgi:hypothetical protein